MVQTGRGVATSAFFIGGMNSAGDPLFAPNSTYRTGMNVINRGGVVRTRPGYRTIFDLPGGKLQGLSYFKPLTAEGYYVFAVAGTVYASQFPFTSFSAIPNIQFYQYAPTVYFCQTVQSAVLNTDGTVSAQAPKRVLVMQDGQFTRAAYWDGASSGHLDPSAPATFQSVIDTSGAVSSVQVTYGGQGYDASHPPIITFQAPSAVAGETYRTATGHVVIDANMVQSVVIDDPGAGYGFAPSIAISGQKLGTPLGGPMAWSGDRLWVAQDNKVFASNIVNPLAFSESIYASGGGFFQFPENVTAMFNIPSFQDPNLAVFTKNTSSVLQSSIRDRSTWQTTQDFQSDLFPGVGCVSHRSVVAKFGEMWWMTQAGFTNFNAAAQSKLTSFLVPQDSEMAVSKFNLASDLSTVCASVYENFMLVSVPYGDRLNDHTWVYDQSVVSANLGSGEASSPAWSGYWTGTRPVEWATGPFNGVPRIAFISQDYDGNNRLWEAFTPDRQDNGSSITSFMETRSHTDFGPMATGLDQKVMKYAEINVSDILGSCNLQVYWAGVRGNYKLLTEYTLNATEGSVLLNVDLDPIVSSYRSQTRRLRTPEIITNAPDTNACEQADVESDPQQALDWRDIAFSLLFVWTGRMAIRSYRIYADPDTEASTGTAEPVVEYDIRVLEGWSCL